MSFNKEVTNAQFFYMDKFILLTSANILYLYKYNVDLSKVDEVKRFLSDSETHLASNSCELLLIITNGSFFKTQKILS